MKKIILFFTLFISSFIFSQENIVEIPKIVIKNILNDAEALTSLSPKFEGCHAEKVSFIALD